MTNNAQKTPFQTGMQRFAERKVRDAIQLTGKSLPCSVVSVAGSIVTVKFEVNAAPFTLPQVTVPMFGPEYVRYPAQVGDLGVVFPVDVRIGGIDGLGAGVADLSVPANLAALVFFPIASSKWSETDDANAVVIYGPNGVVLRDVGKNCSVVVDQENVTVTAKTTLTLQVGSVSIVIDSSGITFNGLVKMNNDLHVTGGVTAGFGGGDAVTLQHHKHGTGAAAAGTSVPTAGT